MDEVISLCGLDPLLKKGVGKYSMDMRQRLGLAQALLNDPDLLVLDKHGVADMRELLLKFKFDGKSILPASHFAQDIDELRDTVCEMDQGVLTAAK